MRISLRMAGAIALAGLVLFGSFGLWLVSSVQRDAEEGLRRELGLLGRGLQVAAENAIQDKQLSDFTEVMEKLARVDPRVRLLLYSPEGTRIASSRGAMAGSAARAAEAAVRSGAPYAWELQDAPEPKRLALALPLVSDQGNGIGTLIVTAPLEPLEEEVSRTRRGVAAVVALYVLVTFVVGLAVGTVLIGRPLARLASAMRRLRDDDPQPGLVVRRRDEVGAVAREFNTMVEDLAVARRSLSESADAQRSLEGSLRQADKLIAIGQISAGLAHEIGSPLQVLVGRAQMLEMAADDPDKVRRTASILVTQVERISRIVQQLLAYARRRAPRIGPLDLAEPVRAVLDLVRHDARRRNITLAIEVEPGCPKAQADPDQVQQIVLNLVSNALSVTPAGGRVAVRVAPSALPDGRQAVQIAVEDSGPGIPEELRPSLFEPFFTTRAAEGGTGLGLSVVRSIAQEHRGAVRYTSSPAGSRFEVDLPAHRQEES